MKKYLISTLLVFVIGVLFSAANAKANPSITKQKIQADSLSEYRGRYEASQNNITLQYELEVVNGKLLATNLTSGQQLNLKHASKDDFMVEEMGIPITFVRDGGKKISAIQMPDGTVWKKLQKSTTETVSPANYDDYLGKYQLNNNGKIVSVEIAAKYGKLWASSSAENINSPITSTGKDSFTINATGEPLKFTRDAGNKVAGLVQKEKDAFVKLK